MSGELWAEVAKPLVPKRGVEDLYIGVERVEIFREQTLIAITELLEGLD
jgi:hypothetical protein